MNGGSSLPLALACWEAGVFPSLYVQVYDIATNTNNYDLLDYTIGEFVKSTGTTDVLVATDIFRLADPTAIKIYKKHKLTHIEILTESLEQRKKLETTNPHTAQLIKNYDLIIKGAQNALRPKCIVQRISFVKDNPYNFILGVKGSEAAGLNSETCTTSELFDRQKAKTPDSLIMPYGGIGTPGQVADYISRGASGVVVGTLFAAAKESTLSQDVKQKMVNTHKQDLIRLPDTGQQALMLGVTESVLNSKLTNFDWNRQKSLEIGLSGNAQVGHMYLGSAIDYVTEIKTVKEIVEYLTSELR
jgi:hypothetical protein